MSGLQSKLSDAEGKMTRLQRAFNEPAHVDRLQEETATAQKRAGELRALAKGTKSASFDQEPTDVEKATVRGALQDSDTALADVNRASTREAADKPSSISRPRAIR